MALQLGLKRSLLSSQSQAGSRLTALNAVTDVAARRWKGTDAGDVIGIDLGTTNSCVAVMVCNLLVCRGSCSFSLSIYIYINRFQLLDSCQRVIRVLSYTASSIILSFV